MGKSLVYVINRKDRIQAVNSAWNSFAAAHDGPDSRAVLGRPLWEFIEGEAMAHVYSALLARVRADHRTVSFPLRCDSPGVHRLLEVRMRPADQSAVRFETTPLLIRRSKPREHPNPLAPITREICEDCGQILIDGVWLPPERAVERTLVFSKLGDAQLALSRCRACRLQPTPRVAASDITQAALSA